MMKRKIFDVSNTATKVATVTVTTLTSLLGLAGIEPVVWTTNISTKLIVGVQCTLA